MDILSAVEWVKENQCTIIGFAKKYDLYCPYGYDDFLSAANEAAILASMRQPVNKKQFLKIFWTGFKKILSHIVPNPLHEDWSTSVPSNMCVEIPTEYITEDEILASAYSESDYFGDDRSNPVPMGLYVDISSSMSGEEEPESNCVENIYLQAKCYLKPKQRTLLYLLLGLDKNIGQCSMYETAMRLGLTPQTVDIDFQIACRKIAMLMKNKKIILGCNKENYQNPPP